MQQKIKGRLQELKIPIFDRKAQIFMKRNGDNQYPGFAARFKSKEFFYHLIDVFYLDYCNKLVVLVGRNTLYPKCFIVTPLGNEEERDSSMDLRKKTPVGTLYANYEWPRLPESGFIITLQDNNKKWHTICRVNVNAETGELQVQVFEKGTVEIDPVVTNIQLPK